VSCIGLDSVAVYFSISTVILDRWARRILWMEMGSHTCPMGSMETDSQGLRTRMPPSWGSLLVSEIVKKNVNIVIAEFLKQLF
jgi:hypothetical protein